MEFAQMTLKTGSPSYSNSNAFQKKEHVKNLNKNLLRTMHTLGSVIKALHYYSILFTMHSSGFIVNTWA